MKSFNRNMVFLTPVKEIPEKQRISASDSLFLFQIDFSPDVLQQFIPFLNQTWLYRLLLAVLFILSAARSCVMFDLEMELGGAEQFTDGDGTLIRTNYIAIDK
ncbi:hypothetical protein [Nitrosomonas sp. Nm33]|uniref:hypothetical protein n=1 Tax=Nitrosomonas sp. Nm33 TaxID=133724 RepID=UPI00115F9D4E|nr:hypothetical protein [Nitrosomonas sp. Nm33]